MNHEQAKRYAKYIGIFCGVMFVLVTFDGLNLFGCAFLPEKLISILQQAFAMFAMLMIAFYGFCKSVISEVMIKEDIRDAKDAIIKKLKAKRK